MSNIRTTSRDCTVLSTWRRLALALSAVVITCQSLSSQPTPLEPGWTVRTVTSQLPFDAMQLAFDPVSTDLFVSAWGAAGNPNLIDNRVYRISQTGAASLIYSYITFSDAMLIGQLEFDPVSRVVYINAGPGGDRNVLRKIDEHGTFLEDVIAPFSFGGPFQNFEGDLFVVTIDPFGDLIMRYEPSDDSFTQLYSNVGDSLSYLAFDPNGNTFAMDDVGIKRISPDGTVTLITNREGYPLKYGDGSLFTTYQRNGVRDIWRVAPDGSQATVFAQDHSTNLNDMLFASNGRIYAVESAGGSRILEYSYIPEPAMSALVICFCVLLRAHRGCGRGGTTCR